MTKYYVDQDGKYLGGFDGYEPIEAVRETQIEKRLEPVLLDGKPMLDAQGNEMLQEIDVGHEVIVGTRKLPKVYPQIPAGAIEVSGPPNHGWDTWDGAQWVPH
jgi:hypothetical protein